MATDNNIPKPGDHLDKPTTMADGRTQTPTKKNQSTTLGSGHSQGHATDTSTGMRTARANEHPAQEQSSGAKKYRVATKDEVEEQMRREEDEQNS